MISDYGTLQTAVAARAVRTDLTTLIPDFIRRAHDHIVGEVVLAADLTLSSNTVPVPTGFREAVSLWLVNRPWLQVLESSDPQMSYATGTGSGVPSLFRVSGSNLILYPSPEPTYPAKLVYRLVTDFFADDDATNAILTKYPFVYLYGSMAECMRQIRDAAEADRYELLFRSEIERINAVEVGDATRGPLQMTSNGPVW